MAELSYFAQLKWDREGVADKNNKAVYSKAQERKKEQGGTLSWNRQRRRHGLHSKSQGFRTY